MKKKVWTGDWRIKHESMTNNPRMRMLFNNATTHIDGVTTNVPMVVKSFKYDPIK